MKCLNVLCFLQVLGSADSMDFQTDLQFPRLWNATQTWNMRFTGDSVQANILFAYIDFINGELSINGKNYL